ncbi:MAG: adenylate/guanylate cyclase domain-containing protein [Candidatus Hydrothermales bacterium]
MSKKCIKCNFENPEGFVYCGRCGSKLIEKRIGERRRVSVMFVDVAGFTDLSERKDAEEVLNILNFFFTEAKKIIENYHGTIDKYIGDAILCFFGVKGEYENHAERAIRAGLEIIDFLNSVRFSQKIGVHIGINSGEILLTEIGIDKPLDYTVLGDTVNLAQRLESLAGFNEILVSESTKDLAGEIFDFKPLRVRKIKGILRKVKVYKVEGIKEKKGEKMKFPFVGREELITALLKEIEEKRRIKVFIIKGEPGCGKTSILNKIAELVKNKFNIFIFRASLYGGDLNILSDEFRKKFKIEKRPFEKNWIEFIRSIRKRKSLFLFDDMQWADSLSYEFIKFVIEKIEIPSSFLIFTREENIPLRYLIGIDTKVFEVKGFNYDEFREFIKKVKPDIPIHLQEEIYEKTKGNPLFITEIIKVGEGKISDKIDSIVISEIERMESELREKIKIISIIGPSFDEELLKLIGFSERDLEKIISKGYIFKEGDKYFFKTPLLQETIYNTLLKEERKTIHKRIWEKIKDRENVNSIYHAYKGGLFEEVIKRGEEITEKLFEKGSISDLKIATDFIEKSCIELKKELPSKILYKRIFSLIHLGYFEEAKKLISRLNKKERYYYELLALYYNFIGKKKECIDILKEGIKFLKKEGWKLLLPLAEVLLDTGNFKKGLEVLKKLKDKEKLFNEKDRLRFLILYQTALENTGEYARSLEICNRIYNETEKLSLREVSNLEYSIAFNLMMLGKIDESEEWFEKSIKNYEFLREYRSLSTVLLEYSYLLYTKGNYEVAIKNIERAKNLAEGLKDIDVLAKSNAYEGIVYLAMGKFKKAENSFKMSIHLLKGEKIHKAIYSNILHNYATLLIYQKKFRESIPYFEDVIRIAKEENNKFAENLNLYSIALSYFLSGEISKALDYIKKPLIYLKREKIPVFLFRTLSLLYKIKILKGEKNEGILKEIKRIAKEAKREDFLLLYKFYKLWNYGNIRELKEMLEIIKERLRFNVYLIERYSISVLKNLSDKNYF